MGVKHQRALPQISTTETLKPNKHAYIMLVSLVREPGPNIKIMRVYNISQVFKLFLWRQLYNYQKYFVLICLFKLQEWSDPCSSWSDLLPCWNRIHKKVVNSKNHKWIRKSIKKEFQIIFTSNPKKIYSYHFMMCSQINEGMIVKVIVLSALSKIFLVSESCKNKVYSV